MQPIQYTRRERDAINRAWSLLEDLASRMDHSTPALLRDARRAQKRDSGSQCEARALLAAEVQNALAGDSSPRIVSQFGRARGRQLMAIFGAHLAYLESLGETPGPCLPALGSALRSARSAHDSALARAMGGAR